MSLFRLFAHLPHIAFKRGAAAFLQSWCVHAVALTGQASLQSPPKLYVFRRNLARTQELTPNATSMRFLSPWLRALLPDQTTPRLIPCALPVAAHFDRENTHETHVIQCHTRRRDPRSHC
jgi:hypothetical protein